MKISRREFLQKSSKGLLAAGLAQKVLDSRLVCAAQEVDRTSHYYQRFEVDEQLIGKVISEGLSSGGDYCDLFFQNRAANRMLLEDKAVNRAASSIDLGVGIRVLKGDQAGYSFTEELTPEAMLQAARTAANIADSGGSRDPVEFRLHEAKNYYPVKRPWESVSIDEKIPFLQNVNDRIFSLDKRIIKCTISFTNETAWILFADSDGRLTFDCQPMITVYAGCTAEQDGRREENYAALGGRCGIELLTDDNIAHLADKAVRETVRLFEAVKPEGGEMEVVLAAGESGILLHEAIGHGMEADFNRKNISIFCDKLEKRVANDFVTIVDDGTVPNNRGTINIDDEGNDSQKTHLVENGILRGYLHDHISAKHYKVTPTGNGRRESFRHAPQPRMRNTYMLPGPHKKEEIIASVKKGLYAEKLTNGQVFIGAGDFTFYVKSGSLIEDGKLTRPVKDVNIIGNGPKVLSDIVMVADDLAFANPGGTCGKNGQWAPVCDGLPTTKVSRITVGGA
jgi:TldD protein